MTFKMSPTMVSFRNDRRHFPTQKEAYVWWVTKLFWAYPELLKDPSIRQGHAVDYFARTPHGLGDQIAKEASYYERINLPSGENYFVNVKLDNRQKKKIISKLARRVGLIEDTDWTWRNNGKGAFDDDVQL